MAVIGQFLISFSGMQITFPTLSSFARAYSPPVPQALVPFGQAYGLVALPPEGRTAERKSDPPRLPQTFSPSISVRKVGFIAGLERQYGELAALPLQLPSPLVPSSSLPSWQKQFSIRPIQTSYTMGSGCSIGQSSLLLTISWLMKGVFVQSSPISCAPSISMRVPKCSSLISKHKIAMIIARPSMQKLQQL